MANPLWYLGRTSRCFVGAEATYGTAPTLSLALRIEKALLTMDPHKYALSPQRYTDPSQRALLLRRFESKFQVDGLMYPSGTLNTVGELDAILANGLGGTVVNTTLATTVASGAGVSGATLTAVTGLAAGQFVEIAEAANGITYVVMLLTVNSGTKAVTWAPALPVTCATADTVVGMVTYPLATALPKSLDIASYVHAPGTGTPSRELLGCVVDKLVFSLDSNTEPKFSISGPAQTFAGSAGTYTPQSEPASWTPIGSESGIPNGLISMFNFNGTIYQITKIETTIENGMAQQNNALGTNMATAYYRNKKRAVTLKATAMVSSDKTLWTPSITAAQTAVPALLQIGNTSGYIWAIYWPAVMVMAPPSVPDTDESQSWDFMMTALSVVGNDEIAIGLG